MSEAKENLLVASPFIKRSRALEIISNVKARGTEIHLQVSVLTDLRPESSLSGATDLEALVDLGDKLPSFSLTHLPSLHAKTYIADRRMAIVTSANLTEGGLLLNLEYGVAFEDPGIVGRIRQDFESFALLGARVPSQDLKVLLGEIEELKVLHRRAEQSTRARARRLFREKLSTNRMRLLRHRAEGQTTNSILSNSILFLLREGPLRTIELHPLIKGLHPDICDDSIELVIGDVQFGKKWKHHVRNAQQYLKREGRVSFDGQRWHLASGP